MLVFCVLFIFIIIYKYLILDPKDCFSGSDLLNRLRSCLARAELPNYLKKSLCSYLVYIYILKIIKLKKKSILKLEILITKTTGIRLRDYYINRNSHFLVDTA